ncbi:winged helix-turn-helix domain-containing protein [Nocardiopsis sp. FIRDI 009]|uniref:helix-turn-helix domain-containing protein n=1 Tax=Nocardiopsis sp. FIRDI 009 TaxID=714197 RepID=UPI000E27E101
MAPGPQGAATLLSPEQERELPGLLDQGPGAHGWDDQCWTLARVNRLIGERYGVGFADPSGVWRMLDRLGLSWQVPAVRAAERDEEDIAAWRTQVWPRVKRAGRTRRGLPRLR